MWSDPYGAFQNNLKIKSFYLEIAITLLIHSQWDADQWNSYFFFSHFNCFFILYLWSCVFTCLKLHYWLWSQVFFLIVTSHLTYYSLHMVYFNVKRNHYLQSNLVENFGNVKDWKTFNVKLLRLSWKIFFITENFKYVEKMHLRKYVVK